jgi:hypothetical protein
LVQDLGGKQNDHAVNDLEETQTDSGQDASVCRCPAESFWDDERQRKLIRTRWVGRRGLLGGREGGGGNPISNRKHGRRKKD